MYKHSEVEEWPDPIAFLEDYKSFAIEARPLLIRIIAGQYIITRNDEERELLHTLAIEQMAFLIETLDAFFAAATQKGFIDIYKLLLCEYHSTSVQKISGEFSKERILAIAKQIVSADVGEDKLNEIKDTIEEHIKFLQKNAKFNKFFTEMCTKLKHKFLVMREKNGTRILIPQAQAKAFKSEFTECIKDHTVAESEDLGYLVNRAEFLKKTICFFIETLMRRLENQESK